MEFHLFLSQNPKKDPEIIEKALAREGLQIAFSSSQKTL